MRPWVAILILLLFFWAGKQLFSFFQNVDSKGHSPAEQTASTPPSPAPNSNLPGLPASLEESLSAAEKQGAAGLAAWLRTNRIYVRDPRLAAIELDYVVLISHQDPAEARRIFNDVKSRTPTFSPIYERVKRLETTFQ